MSKGFILLHKVLTKEKNDTTQILFLVTAGFSISFIMQNVKSVAIHHFTIQRYCVGISSQWVHCCSSMQVSHDALVENKEKRAREGACSL